MAVIFLWQFPPLNFAIFSGNSNPGPLFLLFGFPESTNGNYHPCILPFSQKIAILAPYFCYFARRDSPTTARPQQKPCRSSPARARGKAKAHAEAPAEAPTAPTATGGHKKNDNLSGCRHFGAENGARTRDLNLGKVALYQLSYFRVRFPDWDCKYTTIF